MAKKMSPGLVALSSAAILSVYGVGYALSQPAAGAMAAGVSDTTATPVTSPTASAPASAIATRSTRSAAAPSGSPSASPVAATPTSQTAAATLKDGTYTGAGTSRHGGVNVSVTVQNGRITAAPITSVTTRYSVNVIAGLPAKVVGAQSASVNLVSGATDSSSAYVQAVKQALGKAQTGATPASSAGTVQVTGPRGVIYSSAGQGA